jgi:TetR/AcrR family transcriptional regulator, transcriptional repressor of bet genes
MARKPNTEQRREQIVSGLLEAIGEHGYDKATIQTIAQKVGLAPGLIHYHFRNKEEILLELVKSLAAVAQRRYEGLAASATNGATRLKAYIDARLALGDGAEPQAVAAWVMIGAEAIRQPLVRAAYQDAVAAERVLLEALLNDYLGERRKSPACASHLAAALIALVEGAFQLASAAGDIMPRGYAADMALQLVQRFADAEPDIR